MRREYSFDYRKAECIVALLVGLCLFAPGRRALGQAPDGPQASYDDARKKLLADRAAYRARLRAEKEDCKSAGPACDAARAANKAQSDALTKDTLDLQKACSRLEAAGQPNPCTRRRRPAKQPGPR